MGGAHAEGTPSADAVVTDASDWYAQAYENTADGDYTTPEQSDVTGPQRAPYGAGSHQFTIGQYAVQTELYRTDNYDGVKLANLTRLEYSTFERNTAGGEDRQPTYLRLTVDSDGADGADTSLFFFPANNGTVVNGEWQNWDVTGGLLNVGGDSGAGEISLADYAAAHPDAVLANNRYDENHDGGSISLIAGAANTMTRGEYYVDRVIVGQSGQDTLYDFGSDDVTEGATDSVTVDPDHAEGWKHQAYDDVNYLNSKQEFVAGPGTPPAGRGSLMMSLSDADNSGRVELFRTAQYDGTLVRDLDSIGYSTYTRAAAGNETPQQPVYMRLSVDTDGDNATDDSLFFYPANNGSVEQSAWQTWDAGTGVWGLNGDPGPADSLTLAQYTAAHPDATIVENGDASAPNQPRGGVAFIVGGAGTATQMNGEYFLDDITITTLDAATGSVSSGKEFDLEPTPAPVPPKADINLAVNGKDNGAKDDVVKANADKNASGLVATLYKLTKKGKTKQIDSAELNSKGNHRFVVADKNGDEQTTYTVVVDETETTLGAEVSKTLR